MPIEIPNLSAITILHGLMAVAGTDAAIGGSAILGFTRIIESNIVLEQIEDRHLEVFQTEIEIKISLHSLCVGFQS